MPAPVFEDKWEAMTPARRRVAKMLTIELLRVSSTTHNFQSVVTMATREQRTQARHLMKSMLEKRRMETMILVSANPLDH